MFFVCARFIVECFVIMVRHQHWPCLCVRAHVAPLINTPHCAPPFARYRLHQASPRASFSHFSHHSRVMPLIVAQAECCAPLFWGRRRKSCDANITLVTQMRPERNQFLKPGPAPVPNLPLVGHSNSVFLSLPTALTAWIKSTVTCVTTSPILLQT